jgi:hypothetical protein
MTKMFSFELTLGKEAMMPMDLAIPMDENITPWGHSPMVH